MTEPIGGEWHVLAQLNSVSDQTIQRSEGANIIDLVEGSGADLVETVTELSGSGATGLRVTPLAIYRSISPRA
jgi:acetyl-CoA carboxylase carboxyltransferase component